MTDTKFTPEGLTDTLIDIGEQYGIQMSFEGKRGIWKDYHDSIAEYHDQIETNLDVEREKKAEENGEVVLDEVQINDIGIQLSGILMNDVEDIIDAVRETPKKELNIDALLDKFANGVRELINEHISN